MNDPLIEFCINIGEKYEVIDTVEKSKVQNLIKQKYVRDEIKLIGFSLFECLDYTNMAATNISDSWKWIADFIQNRSVIAFFNPFSRTKFIKLKNGNSFVDYFEDAWDTEFYLTDDKASYLVGYNHSQVLFAMGAAKSWLENDLRYTKNNFNRTVDTEESG